MKAFLILPLVFGALLLIPSFSAVYGGVSISISATTIWVGMGDAQSWSDPNNWDRQVGVPPISVYNHALPELCDLVIIDDGSNAVTVHFDISSYQLGNEMQIGSDDTLVIDVGRTFNHTPDQSCQPVNAFAETIVNLGNFNVFGTLLNNGAFINSGAVLDCGIISGTISIPGIVNECPVVGGEIIPIDTTSLLLAGTQSFSWMIPVVLSVLGIGLLVVSRKSENS